MEIFTVGWSRGWLSRMLGRNPLVRNSDRVEAFATTLAVIAVIIAVPIAAALGTAMKDVRSTEYARQALSRHQVTATALQNAIVHAQVYTCTFRVPSRWVAAGVVHVETVDGSRMLHAGDRFDIWTDESGKLAGPPVPAINAAGEAVGVAVLFWAAVSGALVTSLKILRHILIRNRYSAWEDELDSLAGNEGGRANR